MPVLVKRTSGIIEPVPYFKFPAGEVHIRNFDVSDITQIILNWRGDHTDLAVLSNLVTVPGSVQNLQCPLLVPYLPASRADRILGNESLGKLAYLDLLYAAWKGTPTISYSLGVSFVETWDIHSTVIADPCLTNTPRMQQYLSTYSFPDNSVLLAPDEGSISRVAAISTATGLPYVHATKNRDYATGQLLSNSIPAVLGDYDHIFVIDDICDGGGTFLLLADSIRKQNISSNLHLFITHGIFSKGKSALESRYSTVFALNDWITDTVHY